MTQTLLTPAVNSYVASSDEPLRALGTKEDPRIKEMERKSHRLKTLTLGLMPLVGAAALATFAIFGVFLADANADGQSEPTTLVNNFQRWAVAGVMIMVAVLFVSMSDLSDSTKVRENKAIKKGIHGARHSAQKLGTDIVPVLTQSHVEARIRIDEALRLKLEELNLGWRQGDADRIGALLFRDLNREPVMVSLIVDRGMINSKEIEAALLDIESNAVAPVRNGWL
jgi:hypothetical protein